MVKGVMEIRDLIAGEAESEDIAHQAGRRRSAAVIAQIAVIDIVFSLDSVIAAVGMAEQYVPVMVAAILLAVAVMLLASQRRWATSSTATRRSRCWRWPSSC